MEINLHDMSERQAGWNVLIVVTNMQDFPAGSDSKESACNAEDQSSIPGPGRSPGEGNGYPLQILAWRIPWTEEPASL